MISKEYALNVAVTAMHILDAYVDDHYLINFKSRRENHV